MPDQQPPIPPATQIIAAPQSEDEISLRELWERLMRGKRTILLVTILFLALAGAYLGLSTTVYESKAMVQIGRVADQPIGNSIKLASRLMNAYTPLNTEEAARQLPKLYAVTPDKDVPTTLTLIGRGKSPAQAQTYLQGILNKFIASQREIYDQAVQFRKAQLAQLQNQYQSMVKTGVQVTDRKSADAEAQVLTLLAQSQQMSAASAMLRQIDNAQTALSPINTRPSEITLQATDDPKAAQPKKLVILILALFGGLIIGIFVVLLRDAFTISPKVEEGRES
jgi:uncharacterized protein involved in exopolysaccharide biosynthesis